MRNLKKIADLGFINKTIMKLDEDNQNKFYTSISKYYSEIFPYKPMQLQFIKSRAGELAGKRILDIGCATGELAFHLANEGAKVTGIDLNENLLKQAKNGIGKFRFAKSNKHESDLSSPGPVFQIGNMLELNNDFQPEQFDAVLCFGNTLVHLLSEGLIQKMLSGVFSILKPGGHFLLQILNYDYILGENISELPVIETDNIKFVRKYGFENNSQVVRFQTDLILKKEKETISNETSLLALKSKELYELLSQTNSTEINMFSNFKMEPFGGKHLPLVLSSRK